MELAKVGTCTQNDLQDLQFSKQWLKYTNLFTMYYVLRTEIL